MSIPFTQYLMPDGRKTQIEIDSLGDEVETKAKQIMAAGFRFECEMLSDRRTISFTVTHPTLDDGEPVDVMNKLAQNGPDVPKVVTALIMEFDPTQDYTLED